MTDEQSEQIHRAAQIFREVLEKYSGNKAIVFYGAMGEVDDLVHTGITLSDKIEARDVEHLAFTLVARARDMIDYQEE